MADEALKSLKTLFVSTLVVLLLWLLTWPATVAKYEQYREARDLHAWLLLKELTERHKDLDVFAVPPDESISTYDVERDSQTPQGGDYTERITLEVVTVWPYVATYPITLRPEVDYRKEDPQVAEYARIYRVESPAGELPFSEYLIVFFSDVTRVVPADDEAFRAESLRGLRLMMLSARDRNLPRNWSAVAPKLAVQGLAVAPQALATSNPVVTQFYQESDPRVRTGGVQVFGMPLSISLFYSSIGVILGALAFAAIGPLTYLRESQKPPADTWILSLPRRTGARGHLLESCIVSVTLAWALMPAAILILQTSSRIVLEGWSIWINRLSGIGLVFAAVIFLLAAFELRRVRMRSRG